ncbi:SDR family oxidoreductase [Mesorhizobium sp. M2A.F.Ca.ET.037.01.1.1]|uniref:SDR family NAD(P)-dependent oxidoreductase n=2 Tax=Mesorhizobium TaxID=68287 RepID=UPI000F751ECE|nr:MULTISPECIES: SDR family NAD(P)-dependent oxidoreductase [unclassified Mesorhizobium]RUX22692.1 SDR family oxidoreductase [Mesorhizobium sp. M2A.F.Ca.ET.037.01.1.1]RUY13190.1 SDR family oxidoreductase [Mesorhizobium sp. M2A.F.Ca.ET.040.01.1.1]RVC71081.1 SDR family oxidoreductase [Mesorhizobium sp. M00.F.Ca.ET.038.03.1.1]RVC81251.1 SDR family oxidoreductase [Mesorhizobium sp. M2A.F.Ca.ET.046.02.1.1]RWX71258.1 SDR family oxidoreductase [Mesorhizobium sp. M2A.F.Ca.ET.039.01.1.1]
MSTGPHHSSLGGKTILVAGASSGIGKATAIRVAEAGAAVVLVGRRLSELHAIETAIAAAGGQAVSVQLDVTDTTALGAAVASLPRLDVLINSAGLNIPEPIAVVTEEHYDRLFGLNLKAAFFLSQAAAAKIAAHGKGGAMIHITSQMGHVGAANRTAYCASKHGVEGLVKALAIELAPMNIRVNAIAPTFIETPMTAPMFEDGGFRAEVMSKIPLGRVGVPQDVAEAAAFLASDGAALVTGTSLKVDGGWTAQ